MLTFRASARARTGLHLRRSDYDEPTRALEVNPPEELEAVMKAVYRKMRELGLAAGEE
jgi:hypothetical protein